MKYSDYKIDMTTSPMYDKVTQKLLSLAKDEETKRKMKRNIE